MQTQDKFNTLVLFLQEHKREIENYPWGGVLDFPPCPNMGHIHPDIDEKICVACTDREVDIVLAFGRLVVSVADYGEDDWEREVPVDCSERDFGSWEECAMYIGELNRVPQERMESWIAQFQMAE